MTQIEALSKIEALGQPFFETKDVAALLGVQHSNANKIATRLAAAGLIVPLARGKWALRRANKLAIPEHLTAPYPAYISLHSALYHHGMISQIPSVIYAVSLARTRRYQTPIATISIHHMGPDFFLGYETDHLGSFKIATPEKALLDVFYLGPTRSRLFVNLPEIEFGRGFSWPKAFQFATKIKSPARRAAVERALVSIRGSVQLQKGRQRLRGRPSRSNA
jgi:predicted transcriptional regulator of viral defense system